MAFSHSLTWHQPPSSRTARISRPASCSAASRVRSVAPLVSSQRVTRSGSVVDTVTASGSPETGAEVGHV
jgi:hypothetical protein